MYNWLMITITTNYYLAIDYENWLLSNSDFNERKIRCDLLQLNESPYRVLLEVEFQFEVPLLKREISRYDTLLTEIETVENS